MDDGRWTKDEGTPVIPARQATLRISAAITAQIVVHAQSGYPDEVCGLVAGRDGVATAVYPGRNISPTPAVTYELDHDTLARVFDFEDAGLELVAIYHSHPCGPESPSPTDINLAFFSDSVYLIVSLATTDRPVVRGFRIAGDGVREIAVKSEDQDDVRGLLPGAFDR
jgi:[CysO sulfur-carrier protein]-S-L-cysteine hydrolase